MKREKEQRTRVTGGGGQLPPTLKRIDPLGWIKISALTGVGLATITLAGLWAVGPDAPQASLLELGKGELLAQLHRLTRGLLGSASHGLARVWRDLPDVARDAMIWRGVASAAVGLLPGTLLWPKFMRPHDALIRLRGSARLSGPKAVRVLRARLHARMKSRPDFEIAPAVPYPADMWTRHVLVLGGVGSGKSTAIKPLLEKVLSAGDQALIFDPKGEFTEGFKGPQILAPWDKRSLAWDLAADLRNIQDMRRFAASMIKSSQDPMWANAARQLLVGLLIHLSLTRGKDWGWSELAALVVLQQPELLSIMQRVHPEAVRAVESASVTTAGILINLSSFCSPILDLAVAWGHVPRKRRVSFVAWTKGDGPAGQRQIILQGHGAYSDLTKAYVESVIGTVSALVNSVEMPESFSRKLWFIADELPQMGKIPLRALFEVGRSRGVRCVVACQDLAQLEEIHGKELVRALVAMSGSLLIGQIQQGETADMMCKTFGTVEVERPTTSTPASKQSKTFTREEVPLYKPSELSTRLGLSRDAKRVVLLLFTEGTGYELAYPLYRMKSVRPRVVLAPWTQAFCSTTPPGHALHADEEPAASASTSDETVSLDPDLVEQLITRDELTPDDECRSSEIPRLDVLGSSSRTTESTVEGVNDDSKEEAQDRQEKHNDQGDNHDEEEHDDTNLYEQGDIEEDYEQDGTSQGSKACGSETRKASKES
jgi:hypothetical protein